MPEGTGRSAGAAVASTVSSPELVSTGGLEPPRGSLANCGSVLLSYVELAPPDGIEPPSAGLEPAVLPLNERGVIGQGARFCPSASAFQARDSSARASPWSRISQKGRPV